MTDTPAPRPTLAELDALRDALIRAGGASLEIELGDLRVKMVPARPEQATTAAAAPQPPEQPAAITLNSNGPGILRLSDPAGGPPFAAAGTMVSDGQIIALLQAGAALWPVHATASGQIETVLANEGNVVGYATPLFQLAR